MKTDPTALNRDLLVLQEVLTDPGVNDICINRPGEYFFLKRNTWTRVGCPLLTYEYCENLAQTVGSFNGRNIDRHTPLLSGDLPDGSRVAIVHPPACENGTIVFAIRKHTENELTHNEIAQSGFYEEMQQFTEDLDEVEKELLRLYAHNGSDAKRRFMALAVESHKNIIVSGATGSGKTTYAKSLIYSHVSRDERIITVQNVIEMNLTDHPNRVHLMYDLDGAKAGDVDAKDLVREALRLIPKRIFVSELRGSEAWDWLVSANSAHPGSITTLHSDSVMGVPTTLIQRITEGAEGKSFDSRDLLRMIYASVDVIVHVENWRGKQFWYDPYKKRKALLKSEF